MFRTSDLSLIDSQICKFYNRYLAKTTENLRLQVLDSPTQLTESILKIDYSRLNLKFRKLSEKITLGILLWYFPEEIRFLIQLELEETWGPESREIKEILLSSKDFALTWLIRCSDWNENDFFGNYLNKSFVRLFELTKFRTLPTSKVKRYTGYCRGYQNSNSGVPSSLPSELVARATVMQVINGEYLFGLRLWALRTKVENELYFLKTGIQIPEIIY